MRVKDVMTKDVRTIGPELSLAEAARLLAQLDAGILPVEENDRLIGMVTDRDIVVRGVAQGLGPDAKVRQVLTAEVRYCYEDDHIDEVSRNLADNQVRRLPVLSKDKRLVGIISLADIAVAGKHDATGKALEGVTQRGGLHNQNGIAQM